jgi:glycosyltransferase involved in cell wall biosynthesis
MNKTVSIVIPVYNAEKTLSKCIESILQNTYSDYEIILINDGSADNSWKILESYQKKYSDKIKIFNQKNQGVAKTRNAGLGYANSKYVMFIDCDDWIDSDYLQKFIEEAESKKSDIVIGGYRRMSSEKKLYEMHLKNTEWSKYITMAPWAKIYRKDFLTQNKIEFLDNNIGEDVFFNLQAINLTDKVSIIDYRGYNWFYNQESVSNTKQKTMQSSLDVMRLIDACYGKLKEIGAIDNPEVEFYFTRYIIWYLLFAGRKSSCEEIWAEFTKTFAWLKNKFPAFLKNKNISLFRPKGETLRNRLAVFVFLFFYRLKLIKVFLGLYSK